MGDADGGGRPAPSATTSTADAPTTPPPRAPATRVGVAPGEAERREVALGREGDEPFLRPFAKKVREHFKDAKSRAPYEVQRASLLGGGSATLVRQAGETFPLLVVEDRERRVLWDRDKPTISMTPPVRDPVVVGRAGGGVAIFVYDVPAKVLAGRFLDADGTPFADLNVIASEDCQSVSAAHWPGRGIVGACVRSGSARIQLVRNDNTLAWPREGVPVPTTFRAPAPVAIAPDTEASVMIAHHATIGGADHLVVQRFDERGTPLFSSEKDLGEVPRLEHPEERVVMASLGTGVRITLPRGLVGDPSARSMDVSPDGERATHPQ